MGKRDSSLFYSYQGPPVSPGGIPVMIGLDFLAFTVQLYRQRSQLAWRPAIFFRIYPRSQSIGDPVAVRIEVAGGPVYYMYTWPMGEFKTYLVKLTPHRHL